MAALDSVGYDDAGTDLVHPGTTLAQRTAFAITSDIIEAILHGRQPADMTMTVLMRPFAVAWTKDINRLLTTFGGSP